MSDVKISQLTEASASDVIDDTIIPIVSAYDDTTKKLTLELLKSTFFCNTLCTSITISSAEMLALNSTPKEIVPAQGAGTVIEVISAFGKLNYGTTPYATNVDFEIINAGASVAQFGSSYFINGTVSKIDRFTNTGVAVVSNYNMVENAALNAKVRAGDPTAGDSDFEIFVLYRVITL